MLSVLWFLAILAIICFSQISPILIIDSSGCSLYCLLCFICARSVPALNIRYVICFPTHNMYVCMSKNCRNILYVICRYPYVMNCIQMILREWFLVGSECENQQDLRPSEGSQAQVRKTFPHLNSSRLS